MILDETTKGYNYQLTNALPKKTDLDFATRHFKDNLDRHCIIKFVEERRTKKGRVVAEGYAVFTEGKFIEKR